MSTKPRGAFPVLVRRTFPASHPEGESAAAWKDEARPGKTVEVVSCLARRKAPRLLSPGRQERLRPRLPASASLFCFLVLLPPCQLASWQPGRAVGELAGWMDSRARPARSRLASWQRVMAREEARGGWATDPAPRGACWDPRAPARARGRRWRPEGLWEAGSPGHPCQGGGHSRDSTRGRGHRSHEPSWTSWTRELRVELRVELDELDELDPDSRVRR